MCVTPALQLTETSSRYARKISGTTALQEALKEKQQHIEQLLAERDVERGEVAKATSHVGEIEQELSLLRSGHEQVTFMHPSPQQGFISSCLSSSNSSILAGVLRSIQYDQGLLFISGHLLNEITIAVLTRSSDLQK